MSKTHKITQLKKRIAELEKKLNRYEGKGSIPIRCLVVEKVHPTVIKSERHLSMNSFETMRGNAEYQKSIARMLVMALAENEDFLRTARVEFTHDDVDLETVRARAAIQVLPYYGDMWED